MMSPFSETLPSLLSVSGLVGGGTLLLVLSWEGGRVSCLSLLFKQMSVLLPKWFMLYSSGVSVLMAGLAISTAMSLIPLGFTLLHYPTLGVGLSLSIWVMLSLVSLFSRFSQLMKEYLSDPSLPSAWAMLCLVVESGSRAVRAVTLGGRISVNIMMGSILFSVMGESKTSWGLFVLSVFEGLVVLVQTYVFILLICFYTAESE